MGDFEFTKHVSKTLQRNKYPIVFPQSILNKADEAFKQEINDVLGMYINENTMPNGYEMYYKAKLDLSVRLCERFVREDKELSELYDKIKETEEILNKLKEEFRNKP